MKTINRESTIFDNGDFSVFLQGFIELNCPVSDIETTNMSIELNNALKSLSAIEQSVIFLLFNEELSQSEAAQMLELYSKTVSKIKIRAIRKLKEYLEGDSDYEK